jgi:hypothetical protein
MSTGTDTRTTDEQTGTDDADDADNPSVEDRSAQDRSVQDLSAQVELLREENRRLRDRYARTRRTEYRRAALGMGVVGVVAALGGAAFPDSRATLFALAGIGLFTCVLTYYLTPERFVAASVGERTSAALGTLGAELVSELGLRDARVYVPAGSATGDPATEVRLFVPEHADHVVPEADDLGSLFVVTDDEREHGVALPSTGAALFAEFTRTMADGLAETPVELAEQATEALVEGFELADAAVPEFDAETPQVTVGVDGSAFGDVGRFDHPVTSFVATCLAVGLDAPVRVETVDTDDDRFDHLLRYTWDADDDSADGDSTDG